MTMNTNAQDKWFEQIPSAIEKLHFRDALIAILADQGMGDGGTESIYEMVPIVIERLHDV